MTDIIREQLTIAKTTLQAIAYGSGIDAQEQARIALKNIEALAASKDRQKPCPWCAQGLPRMKFNRIHQHILENGDEVNCTSTKEAAA